LFIETERKIDLSDITRAETRQRDRPWQQQLALHLFEFHLSGPCDGPGVLDSPRYDTLWVRLCDIHVDIASLGDELGLGLAGQGRGIILMSIIRIVLHSLSGWGRWMMMVQLRRGRLERSQLWLLTLELNPLLWLLLEWRCTRSRLKR